MNALKRLMMAIASTFIIVSSVSAYTTSLTVHYPGVPDYKIIFYENNPPYPFGDKEDENTEGKCSFCWFNDCWDYNYVFDGKKTFVVEKVGVFYLIKNSLFGIPFTMSFDK